MLCPDRKVPLNEHNRLTASFYPWNGNHRQLWHVLLERLRAETIIAWFFSIWVLSRVNDHILMNNSCMHPYHFDIFFTNLTAFQVRNNNTHHVKVPVLVSLTKNYANQTIALIASPPDDKYIMWIGSHDLNKYSSSEAVETPLFKGGW